MYINEAFSTSVGTQRADLGKFKIFCMDITSLVMPNLIAQDLLLVQPMSSFSGNLVYMEYGLGEEKGGVGGRNTDGSLKTVVNNPWTLGEHTEARTNYTGEAVVEAITSTSAAMTLAWSPVVKEAFENAGTKYDVKIIAADGAVTYANLDNDGKVPAASLVTGGKVAYKYDNVVVPQSKLPTFIGQMKNIAVSAKVRRIAVVYSQIAAFQAKTDYGLDFESTIAQQAQAELSYEIDAEAVYMLKEATDAACTAGKATNFTWVDEELDTISYSMKAEGFARKLEEAKMSVYKRTNRFMPTWMLVSPDMMPILTFVPGFKANSALAANGPYVAGEIAGMKVVVSPILGEKVCYLGVLGADGKTAVGYYMPYMPIVPTQLLGFADGSMEQGFSTVYAMGIINAGLTAKITVTTGNNAANVLVVESSEFDRV